MPLCMFSEARGTDARLGWVDQQRQTIVRLPGTLAELLGMDGAARSARIASLRGAATATYALPAMRLRAPVDRQEIWAAGVTYERSRAARMEESTQQDVYDRVYRAERPEVFFKAPAWRCVGPDD